MRDVFLQRDGDRRAYDRWRWTVVVGVWHILSVKCRRDAEVVGIRVVAVRFV